MALVTYTTYNSVRAVLGVSLKELPDATIALAVWELQFLLEMSDVDQGGGVVKTQFNIANALAEVARTENQQRLLDLVGMLAAYSVARQMLTPASLFAPKKISDGRAEIERFADNNFDRVRLGVQSMYSALIKRLAGLIVVMVPGANVAAVVARRMIGAIPLGTDPVTGE